MHAASAAEAPSKTAHLAVADQNSTKDRIASQSTANNSAEQLTTDQTVGGMSSTATNDKKTTASTTVTSKRKSSNQHAKRKVSQKPSDVNVKTRSKNTISQAAASGTTAGKDTNESLDVDQQQQQHYSTVNNTASQPPSAEQTQVSS